MPCVALRMRSWARFSLSVSAVAPADPPAAPPAPERLRLPEEALVADVPAATPVLGGRRTPVLLPPVGGAAGLPDVVPAGLSEGRAAGLPDVTPAGLPPVSAAGLPDCVPAGAEKTPPVDEPPAAPDEAPPVEPPAPPDEEPPLPPPE